MLARPTSFRAYCRRYTTSSFRSADTSITKTTTPRQKLPLESLKFGASFTDHWLKVGWSSKSGWDVPVIEPYSKITLDPSALVFHYALEGMKAYKDARNQIRLFRPMENMKRMNTSANRLGLPTFAEDEFLGSIKQLLKVDSDWIPNKPGYSLYLRPTMIATTPLLGVSPPQDALLYVIMSPVGPYYPTGFKPVKLLADESHVRAWPGGSGGFKIGSNYAPTIQPARLAQERGYQQIMWLLDDAITEVGTMNVFGFWINEQGEKELITAPLDGTILPGVTRKTILELARGWNEFKVTERTWRMPELIKAIEEKRLIEVFGAGTAAIVSSVSGFEYKNKFYDIPCKNNVAGDLTQRFLDTITAIQYGEVESPWSVVVE